MAQKRRVTVKDVADKAGCSIGAVSVVLSKRASTIRVSAKMREHIEKVAEDCGFVANYHAQSLQLRRSHCIGLLMGEQGHRRLANGFWSKYVAGVDLACREAGYDLSLVGPRGGQSEIERGILQLKQTRLDALIVMGGGYRAEELKELDALNYPVVYIQVKESMRHPRVVLEEETACEEGMLALKALGHRGLVYVSGEGAVTRSGGGGRQDYVRRLAKKHGLNCQVLNLGEALWHSNGAPLEELIAGTRAAVTEWVKANGVPGAMVFYSDLLALGGVAALREVGAAVPERTSVWAFDDVRAVLNSPALSVVSLELMELGRRAVEMARRMIETKSGMAKLRGEVVVVPARWIQRESVCAAPMQVRRGGKVNGD